MRTASRARERKRRVQSPPLVHVIPKGALLEENWGATELVSLNQEAEITSPTEPTMDLDALQAMDLDGDGIIDEKEMEAAHQEAQIPKPVKLQSAPPAKERPTWMFHVVAKKKINRKSSEDEAKMTRVAAFMEKKARGPKAQILQAFKRFRRMKKQERAAQNMRAKEEGDAMEQAAVEMNALRVAREEADQARVLHEMRREYKQAVFFRDQVVFLSKKLHTIQARHQMLQNKVQEASLAEQKSLVKQSFDEAVQLTLHSIDRQVQARELKLQTKHDLEWKSLQQHIRQMKKAIPPAPDHAGQCKRQTLYSPQSAEKLQLERTLAHNQKYETAQAIREQIDADECDAYDHIIASHAVSVEQMSDELAQRQIQDMKRFVECAKRVSLMTSRIVRMCSLSIQDGNGDASTEETITTLLDPIFFRVNC